jgi:hypothetical protein
MKRTSEIEKSFSDEYVRSYTIHLTPLKRIIYGVTLSISIGLTAFGCAFFVTALCNAIYHVFSKF